MRLGPAECDKFRQEGSGIITIQVKSGRAEVFVALALCVMIILSAVLCAQGFTVSRVYRQSKIVSMLVRQGPVNIFDLLGDAQGARMVIKFAGALAAAYINFERIPVNEASTFMAVFESLPGGVYIDRFYYRRKDLEMLGEAAGLPAVKQFLKALEASGAFVSVTERHGLSLNGRVQFEVVCATKPYESILDF